MRYRKRWVLLVVLALVILGGALAYGKYTRLRPHVLSALELAYRLQGMTGGREKLLAQIKDEGLPAFREDLGRLETDLRVIRQELRPVLWLCPSLRWVPRLGEEIAVAPDLLDMGIHLSSAGWWVLLGVEPVANIVLRPERGELSALAGETLPLLAVNRPRFLEAQEALERAIVTRQRFQDTRLMDRLAGPLAQLDQLLPLAQLGLQGALAAPELLGAEGERRYLLLAQNNQEMRPTGGFISGVGLLRVERGDILEMTMSDSYAVDNYLSNAHPPAPEPLARYMWAGLLLLRDANWSPDFPTSAEVIASLYQLDQDTPALDGVIAADLTAVEWLVGALGPLQVPNYPQPVTGDNVLALLQEYWAAPVGAGTIEQQGTSDWWQHRKDFMGDLLGGLLDKVKANPTGLDLSQLLEVGVRCLEEKHVLVHLRDDDLHQRVAAQGWDGALRQSEGDYLLVVDANFGFNKTDVNIERRIAYEVELDRTPPLARLLLTYTNRSIPQAAACRREDLLGLTKYQGQSYIALTQGCYWDYVRLYAPLGSRLLSVEGAQTMVDSGQEQGKSVFGTLLLVEPGQERQLSFTYELPASLAEQVAASGYRLLVQKQPGTAPLPLQLGGWLPATAGSWEVQPQGVATDGGALFYEATLVSDQEIRLRSAPAAALWPRALAALGALLLLTGLLGRWRMRERSGDEKPHIA